MWDKIYKKKNQLSVWPWTEVVSLVSQYCFKNKSKSNTVLELGFGVGANIPFFLKEKFHYYGIEQSKYAVNLCKKKFKKVKKNLIKGDFTKKNIGKVKFDLILDRGSCTHLKFEHFKKFIDNLPKKLKNNGKFIFIDLFSDKTSSINNYKVNKKSLKKMGIKKFYNLKTIKMLFRDFNILYLSENTKNIFIKGKKVKIATWSAVLEKRV